MEGDRVQAAELTNGMDSMEHSQGQLSGHANLDRYTRQCILNKLHETRGNFAAIVCDDTLTSLGVQEIANAAQMDSIMFIRLLQGASEKALEAAFLTAPTARSNFGGNEHDLGKLKFDISKIKLPKGDASPQLSKIENKLAFRAKTIYQAWEELKNIHQVNNSKILYIIQNLENILQDCKRVKDYDYEAELNLEFCIILLKIKVSLGLR